MDTNNVYIGTFVMIKKITYKSKEIIELQEDPVFIRLVVYKKDQWFDLESGRKCKLFKDISLKEDEILLNLEKPYELIPFNLATLNDQEHLPKRKILTKYHQTLQNCYQNRMKNSND